FQQLENLLPAELLVGVDLLRGEEIGVAHFPEVPPLGIRGEKGHGEFVEVEDFHGEDGVAVGEDFVVLLEDLSGHGWRRGDDGGDSAQLDAHQRPVFLGEVGQRSVRLGA
ncbi:unnamed protein product, partial [Linum tenue]